MDPFTIETAPLSNSWGVGELREVFATDTAPLITD
jgi:hypothetical protein